MTYDDHDAAHRIGISWPSGLALFIVLTLGLVPLACSSSTADSNENEEATEETAAEDENETYDIPTYTGDRTVEQRLGDASLAAQITRALVRQRDLRIFDFEPEVNEETVTLRGDVNTRSQWERAERTAAGVAQGRTVVNEVTIGGRPANEVDEEEGAGEGVSAAAAYHTVQRGESLWQIARQHGTSVQRIRGLNDLASDGLQVGQRIRVR